MKTSNYESTSALMSLGQIPKSQEQLKNKTKKCVSDNQGHTMLSQLKIDKLKRPKTPNKENINIIEQEEKVQGIWMKNCLREAIDENDKLRNKVIELEALFAAASDEIELRNKAILELSNTVDVYYQILQVYCLQDLKIENQQLKKELLEGQISDKSTKQKLF